VPTAYVDYSATGDEYDHARDGADGQIEHGRKRRGVNTLKKKNPSKDLIW